MKDADIGHGVRKLITAWLAWHEDLDRRERRTELEQRVEGFRMVNGGQTDPDGSWEVTDAVTGELLASGVGNDSYEAEWQESWFHVDAIGNEAHDEAPRPDGDFGLPHGFADIVRDWVVDQPVQARELLSD